MIFYVTHACAAGVPGTESICAVVHDLQVQDLANCYISPTLLFSHLANDELTLSEQIELRLDVLQCCDKLVVVGTPSVSMQAEIDFAKLVGMEVLCLGQDGRVRPFS